MHNEINASEALAGFCGWLTTRKEITKFGSTEDCAVIGELIQKFSEVNNLQPVTNDYPNNINIPKE